MKNLLAILLLISFVAINAQDKEKKETKEERQKRYINEGNPFKKYGYTPKIATLSNGKYREFFVDTIIQIGSFEYNRISKEITGFTLYNKEKLSEADLQPELVSRWMSPDPLSDEFPSWSPYNFAKNNPVRYIDPDGRASEDIIIKGRKSAKNTFISVINQGLGGNFASYDKKGNVTLNVSRDDLKTDAQKGMFDIINKAITNKGITTLKLLNHKDVKSDKIIAGSFMKNNSSLGKLDVDDIAAYGTKDPVMNQTTVLAHEVDEQFRKQVLGNNIYSNSEGTGAHDRADGVFETITGYTRGVTDLGDGIKYDKVVRPGNKYYTRSYTATIPFTKNGNTHTVKYQVIKGQVVKKE